MDGAWKILLAHQYCHWLHPQQFDMILMNSDSVLKISTTYSQMAAF